MPSYPGFLGPANKSQSYMADDELLINWYLEKNESPNAPTPWAMLPCPGFTPLVAVAASPIRAMFYQNGRAFFVAGSTFYELTYIALAWSTISRGTMASDVYPATISANGDAGNQLWITSGGIGYIYDLNANTLAVAGVPGTTVSMGGFLSARFLYLDATTGAFYASAQYDGTSWDATMVAQSDSGNPWRALAVTPDGLIRLLGESSGEAWADQGTSPFPFSKITNASIPFGIVSPFAWTVDTAITWVAQNQHGRGVVVRATGYVPERISTHAIEFAIQRYPTLSDTLLFSYQDLGHFFTILTFPTGGQTWAYDGQTNLWGERAHWDITTGAFEPYRIAHAMSAFGKLIVGDRLSGGIYEMSTTVHTDVDDAVIRRVRQPPRLSFDQVRFTVQSLHVVLDAGLGLSHGSPGANPQLSLQTSRDGGKTFGNIRSESAGAIGAYATRVVFTGCGQARNRVDRFIATDPIPWRIVDCVIDYRIGTS